MMVAFAVGQTWGASLSGLLQVLSDYVWRPLEGRHARHGLHQRRVEGTAEEPLSCRKMAGMLHWLTERSRIRFAAAEEERFSYI
eukprot:COSAG04_NODE_429_length_14527_cov_119.154422_9_plen_84_part_00